MRKFFVLACTALAFGADVGRAIAAPDWVQVSQLSEDGFFDGGSVTPISQSLFRVWWRTVLPSKAREYFRGLQGGPVESWDAYSHTMFLAQVDCSGRKQGALVVGHYDTSAALIGEFWEAPNDEVKMKHVVPGSTGDRFVESFCGYAKKIAEKGRKAKK